MKILFEYSQGCTKHINQDAYGHNDNIFWVIDGATEVFENNCLSSLGDVYWVVQTLNKKLKEGNTLLPLKDFVGEAISKMYEMAVEVSPSITEIPINVLPTYAICCIRCMDSYLEYFFLGDCSLFVSHTPDIRYTDNRIEPFHLQVNAVKEQYKDNVDLYRSEVLKKVREIKKYINAESGYWIGTFDASIASHAIVGKVDIRVGDHILLCTDGFRPSLDEANLFEYNPLDIFYKKSLQSIITKQNKAELKHFMETGIDIADDKTIVLIQI